MDEATEAGLGILVSGGIFDALAHVAVFGLSGLATGGTALIAIGAIVTGVGLYRTLRSSAPAADVPGTN